jgi:ABC-2 type transport system ATP-binding protein
MDDLISLEHVWKSLSGRQILKDVSFAVKKGDIFGFLGPNGAGKTTSIRLILGLLRAESGTTTVLGRDAGSDRPSDRIGFVLEVDGLYDNLSARDNLAYYGRIYRVSELEKRVAEGLELAGLGSRGADKVGTFSKGMRQRLALARAMLHDPALLVLDEPTAGVDPAGQVEVREALLQMIQAGGRSVLLSSHNLDEVQRICNRVALIHRGEIRLYGELAELEQQTSKGEVVIRTAEPVSATVMNELRTLPGVEQLSARKSTIDLRVAEEDVLSSSVALLVNRGAAIREVTSRTPGLEELYLSIVSEAGDGDA